MSPFAHLLHALRLQHGIRQAELAALLGYEQSYISALEVGIKGPPTDEFVDRLVQGLQLTQGDEVRLRDAVSASQRKLVIDRDTPEDGYWLLKELREQFESLSPEADPHAAGCASTGARKRARPERPRSAGASPGQNAGGSNVKTGQTFRLAPLLGALAYPV
ncbi:helix-turn-helix domain-containing protein [Paludibacterium denitrificans]|uniref:helix-turn-helix domain-containing protein n=1 Tax=Paludibacterium denitrificans TaxID=2675226 RepID=UPI0035E40955